MRKKQEDLWGPYLGRTAPLGVGGRRRGSLQARIAIFVVVTSFMSTTTSPSLLDACSLARRTGKPSLRASPVHAEGSWGDMLRPERDFARLGDLCWKSICLQIVSGVASSLADDVSASRESCLRLRGGRRQQRRKGKGAATGKGAPRGRPAKNTSDPPVWHRPSNGIPLGPATHGYWFWRPLLFWQLSESDLVLVRRRGLTSTRTAQQGILFHRNARPVAREIRCGREGACRRLFGPAGAPPRPARTWRGWSVRRPRARAAPPRTTRTRCARWSSRGGASSAKRPRC